jgi:hypothetical protein
MRVCADAPCLFGSRSSGSAGCQRFASVTAAHVQPPRHSHWPRMRAMCSNLHYKHVGGLSCVWRLARGGVLVLACVTAALSGLSGQLPLASVCQPTRRGHYHVLSCVWFFLACCNRHGSGTLRVCGSTARHLALGSHTQRQRGTVVWVWCDAGCTVPGACSGERAAYACLFALQCCLDVDARLAGQARSRTGPPYVSASRMYMLVCINFEC